MSPPSPWITASSDRLDGEAVFTGTRVPIRALLDDLEGRRALGEFLADFPAVSREHAVAVLELARQALVSHSKPNAA